MRPWFWILAVGFSLVACGENPQRDNHSVHHSGNGILGGRISEKSDIGFKSLVEIEIPQNEEYASYCTGTVIDRRHVLTAGHCTLNASDGKDVNVYFAADPEKMILGERIFVHPIYEQAVLGNDVNTLEDEAQAKDLAIIRLKEEIPQGVEVALLPVEWKKLPESLNLQVFGYGKTSPENNSFDGRLRVVSKEGSIRFSSESLWTEILGFPRVDLPEESRILIFDQRDQTGLCQGDSGGPSFEISSGKPVLFGVSSFVRSVVKDSSQGPEVHPCHWEGVSILVPGEVVQWIQDTIQMSERLRNSTCELSPDRVKDIAQEIGMEGPLHHRFVKREETNWIFQIDGKIQSFDSPGVQVIYSEECEQIALKYLPAKE